MAEFQGTRVTPGEHGSSDHGAYGMPHNRRNGATVTPQGLTGGQDQLVCNRCQPTEAANVELRQALVSISEEHEHTLDELRNARDTLRTVERQKAALRAELTKVREDGPQTKLIMGFQEFWKVATGQTNVRLSSKGKRFKDAEQAFKLATEPELREAVRGAVLRPWVSFGRRYVTRPTDDRKVYDNAEIKLSIYDIVGSDDKIDKHRRIYQEAQAAVEKHPDLVIADWKLAAAVEAEHSLLVMRLAGTKDREVEPSEETLKSLARADYVLSVLDAEPSNVVSIREAA
jgi:hypothetical protein